jgi:hypothetical protein
MTNTPWTTASAASIALVDELDDAFDELAYNSDADEAFNKHVAYGLIAILWGYRPWLDNVDYPSPGLPGYLYDDELDEHDRVEYVPTTQAPVLGQVWWNVYNIVHAHGPAATLEAIIDAGTNDTREDRPGLAEAVMAKWTSAAETYSRRGPNPYGLTYQTPPYELAILARLERHAQAAAQASGPEQPTDAA